MFSLAALLHKLLLRAIYDGSVKKIHCSWMYKVLKTSINVSFARGVKNVAQFVKTTAAFLGVSEGS